MDKQIVFIIAFIIFIGAFLQFIQTRHDTHQTYVVTLDKPMESEVKRNSFEESEERNKVKIDETEERNKVETDEVEERMKLKRTILKRGCLMVKSLNEMSQNGTSFENLLKWHQRIENISFPISNDGKECYPPFLAEKVPLVMYQIHTEDSR